MQTGVASTTENRSHKKPDRNRSGTATSAVAKREDRSIGQHCGSLPGVHFRIPACWQPSATERSAPT